MKPCTARRCVHLDFHTSPSIPDIGASFSKENFQKALTVGKVESITVFAKCHHGYCYYPTSVGTQHPNLNFDLTTAWIEAAHEIGIKAPIYITGGFSALDAEQHPEWRAVNKDGTYNSKYDFSATEDTPIPNGAWANMCLSGGYADHIYELTEEICKKYREIDGLFYDIVVQGGPCYCEHCKAGMRKLGIDIEDPAAVREYWLSRRQVFMIRCREIMEKYHPNASIFFNSGGASPYHPRMHGLQSHYEIEDLPSNGGGYDKLPFMAKYFSRYGKPYIGMTGKFHLTWGEFGMFKSKEALRYEVTAMAMQQAGCSIGDHCHPDGEMELQTYENIGYAYDYYEKIRPFCIGKPVTDLGIVAGAGEASYIGLGDALAEAQLDYRVLVDDEYDQFDTVILSDSVTLKDASVKKLQQYIAKGGKVLAFGDSIVRDGKFLIDVGAEYVAPAPYDVDYIYAADGFGADYELPNAPMLCYRPGAHLKATDGEVLAYKWDPYFSRTYGHYCGHLNTPHNKKGTPRPAIVKKGNVVYVAQPMPKIYKMFGSLFHKRYMLQALRLLYRKEPFKVNLGAQGMATLVKQEKNRRYCLNLLYGSPVRRGKAEVIEDLHPLYRIPVELTVPERIVRVTDALTGEAIPFAYEEDSLKLTVPELHCHSAILFEY